MYFLISPSFLHNGEHGVNTLLGFAFFHLAVHPTNHSALVYRAHSRCLLQRHSTPMCGCTVGCLVILLCMGI